MQGAPSDGDPPVSDIADDWKKPFSKMEMEALRDAARNEETVRERFWHALKRVGRNVPFSEDLVAAFYAATDSRTEFRVRAMLFGALAYFVMPIDVLPDLLPLAGFTDDAAVLALTFRALIGAIRPEHREKARDILKA